MCIIYKMFVVSRSLPNEIYPWKRINFSGWKSLSLILQGQIITVCNSDKEGEIERDIETATSTSSYICFLHRFNRGRNIKKK